MQSLAVILPAAGAGIRFGSGRPKQFRLLAGAPLLQHALDFFSALPAVTQIVMALPAGEAARLRTLLQRRKAGPPVRLVRGGATRQESVARALRAVDQDCEWVAVHDVVRPFADPRLMAALLKGARRTGAAIPGLPVTDTLKSVDGRGFVRETVSRESLYQVQTPQLFRRSILEEAFQRARREGTVGTDESTLVERLGIRVRMVTGSRHNLKITHPEDLVLAECLAGLRERRR